MSPKNALLVKGRQQLTFHVLPFRKAFGGRRHIVEANVLASSLSDDTSTFLVVLNGPSDQRKVLANNLMRL